jgi:S1-C subfamily serine protease
MSEEVFEPSSSDTAPPSDSDTQPIALPPPIDPMAPRADEPPTASYALGALAGNPHLDPTPPAAGSQLPPPPQSPYPPSGAWAPPPPSAPAPARGGHTVVRGLLAFGAALVLLGGGIGIGYAAWKSPSHLSVSQGFNRSGSGSFANPYGGVQPPNGFGNGQNGQSFGGGGGFNGGGSQSSVGSGPSDAASIASKVDPGLVDINTSLGYQSEQAAGTGIVLTSSGEVLTNNHVIEGATSISVTDVGNQKTYTAQVVGYDRSKDVAVLQLHNASGLQTANIGDSSKLSVGQQVVGIGNAGGTGGTPSYAGGTLTALNQSITASNQGDGTSEQLTGLIQTNANIQPGDSGGSLVNTSGQVIGLDTAASAGFSFQSPDGSGGEGFAIPINAALSIARQIEAGHSSSTVHVGETAFLGVEIETQNAASGQFGGGGGNQPSGSGAVVAGVVTSSPAQDAGLAQGDVITSVDGTTVTSPDAVTAAMEQHHPGDKVTIAWTDTSGNSNHATVQLTSGPPQ